MSVSEIVGALVIVYLVGYVLYLIYYALALYHINPFLKLKPLSPREVSFLKEVFPIYGRLPKKLRERCNLRIAWFRSRKKFVLYGSFENKEELKLLISATAALLTLGLNTYKMTRSVLRIIVYPSQYYSRINRRHHLGEYNANLKSLVFSADTLLNGFEITDDNKNLAAHEFAHALSFEMTKKSSWEARRFRVGFRKIDELFKDEHFMKALRESGYFRAYGMTNVQEFFSVAVENYFETPSDFHHDHPKLFDIVQRMLNFDYEIACIFNLPKTLPEN